MCGWCWNSSVVIKVFRRRWSVCVFFPQSAHEDAATKKEKLEKNSENYQAVKEVRDDSEVHLEMNERPTGSDLEFAVFVHCNLSLCIWGAWSLTPSHCNICNLQILEGLNKMCSSGVWKKQQRLLKNMGAHKVMLDLLQVSYDKVSPAVLMGPAACQNGGIVYFIVLFVHHVESLIFYRMTLRCRRL